MVQLVLRCDVPSVYEEFVVKHVDYLLDYLLCLAKIQKQVVFHLADKFHHHRGRVPVQDGAFFDQRKDVRIVKGERRILEKYRARLGCFVIEHHLLQLVYLRHVLCTPDCHDLFSCQSFLDPLVLFNLFVRVNHLDQPLFGPKVNCDLVAVVKPDTALVLVLLPQKIQHLRHRKFRPSPEKVSLLVNVPEF